MDFVIFPKFSLFSNIVLCVGIVVEPIKTIIQLLCDKVCFRCGFFVRGDVGLGAAVLARDAALLS